MSTQSPASRVKHAPTKGLAVGRPKNRPPAQGKPKKLPLPDSPHPAAQALSTPQHLQAMFARGFELHKQGQFDQAQTLYQQVLAQVPRHFDALHLSGVIRAQQGDATEAEAIIARAIEINPNHASAWSNRANSLQELQRHDEALTCYDRAIELNPNYAEAYRNRGDCRWAKGQHEGAAADYAKALEIDPGFFNGWLKWADMNKKLLRWPQAREGYQRYLGAHPENWMAHFNLGFTCIQLNDPDAAETAFRTVLQHQPNHADAHGNLGIALQKKQRLAEALESYETAIRHNPNHADAFSNRGLLLQELNRPEEAMACYNRALEIKPDFANAWWNKSLSLLLAGDFENGWPLYEWRWRSVQLATDRPWTAPRWDGQTDLTGKTILLFAEQGFGDTIHFIRYALEIKARGAARVVVEVQAALAKLMARMPGLDGIAIQGSGMVAHDIQCPLMSLPGLLQTRLHNIPAPIPYLKVDPALRSLWQNRLGARTDKPRIGIAWSGRPTHNNDHHRSLPLARLLPLLSDRFEWVSLQKEVREADRPVLAGAGIRTFAEHLRDFADTAALVEQLDLVISVDTSVVHLAGALGQPVWVMLPEVPDWRWLMDREDTPWYPTMRLYRQGADKNYDSVLQRIAADLTDWQAPVAPVPVHESTPEPLSAVALFQRGHALHLNGDTAGAIRHYQQALQLDPEHFDATHLLGVCLAQQGDNVAAATALDRALKLNDQSASLWSNRGNVLHGLKRSQEAIDCYRRAVQLAPDHVQAWFNLALSLRDLKQHPEAIEALSQVLRVQPEHVDALSNRALALRELKRPEQALADFNRVIALQPEQARHHSNRGLVLSDLGRVHEAAQSFSRALSLQPRHTPALYNMGLLLHRLNRLDEAIAMYDRAIEIDPQFTDAQWNRSLSLLLAGRLEEGWLAYEWRWKKPEVQPLIRHDLQRTWLGQGGWPAIAGKTLLLHAEQGLGDTLMFCRYAPLLAQHGAQIVLEVQPELRGLLARSLPGCRVIAQGEPVPHYHHHIPLMSLPRVLGTTLHNIPASNRYLQADPLRIQRWRDTLGPQSQPRVGIVYSGRPQHHGDAKRSIPLVHLRTLLPPDVEIISLQCDLREADRDILQASGMGHVGDRLTDFDETAALCMCLDAVICVDTSVAHLAAALGRPTHVLIPRAPDWRWLLDRPDTPWYPTMHLHRQAQDGVWPLIRLTGATQTGNGG